MTTSEYILSKAREYGITDAFGVPGGVILDLVSQMCEVDSGVSVHLCSNEQSAAFAALGYARSSGKPGLAFATRGPGIMNMITAIGEAFQESIPTVFITGHGKRKQMMCRFDTAQEIEIIDSSSDFTKMAVSVDDLNKAASLIDMAFYTAVSGRKGPILLDISSELFNEDIIIDCKKELFSSEASLDYSISKALLAVIKKHRRPVLLIGDGLRYTVTEHIKNIIDSIGMPVLSSRGASDLVAISRLYYGYIGSHGIRYANRIFSEADLVIAVGNRLGFPVESESYKKVVQNKTFIHVDIDKNELRKPLQDYISVEMDGMNFLKRLALHSHPQKYIEWRMVCNDIKKELYKADVIVTVEKIASVLNRCTIDNVIVGDVGNNEFWLSRAYEWVRPHCSLFLSKNFGTLGMSLSKSIGTFYATHKRIICFTGDQGFLYSIQELNYLRKWKLPITVVVINNRRSGMIRDTEERRGFKRTFLVDEESGYSCPDLSAVASAYGIPYRETVETQMFSVVGGPFVMEIKCDTEPRLQPFLPKGNDIDHMEPCIGDINE